MSTPTSKLLLVQVAALGWDVLQSHANDVTGLSWTPLESVFPAVTCTAQATMRTGLQPRDHGMIANGLYHRDLRKPMFWEQSSALVRGDRIWKKFRAAGGTVGMLFWQQSLGEEVDVILSPKPVHTHSGGLIQDCYSQPHDLYARICDGIGRRFDLKRYWGPLASHVVGDWIVDAVGWVMRSREHAPDLLCTYLPSLDYDLQRFGPESDKARDALAATLQQLGTLVHTAEDVGYDVVVVGDYAIGPVGDGVAFPNRALHAQGLFADRVVRGRSYPDFHGSRAFAMVDHEIAHVYLRDEAEREHVREVLQSLPEVGEVTCREELPELDHVNCGALVLTAKEGCWFAYPWWGEGHKPPDFARHIDIHNKPGFDPCEVFWGWPPLCVSQDVSRIRGSHGRVGAARRVACASTVDLLDVPSTQLELARAIQALLV